MGLQRLRQRYQCTIVVAAYAGRFGQQHRFSRFIVTDVQQQRGRRRRVVVAQCELTGSFQCLMPGRFGQVFKPAV